MKRDKSGGNGDIFFIEDGKCKKTLRNTSNEKKERYMREIQVMNSFIDNPIDNIVKVLEIIWNEKGEKSAIIMKKYDGDLTDILEITRGNVALTVKLILPVVEALFKLTQLNPAIYHRDLKPGNILYEKIGDEIKLYITDFGLCYLVDRFENAEFERLTQYGTQIGSRNFMAPENEMGKIEDINEKGDIFSIGKIIWSMLNGKKDEFLFSNYWYLQENDLTIKFPNDIKMLYVNRVLMISLEHYPESRADYATLISLLKEILNNKIIEKSKERDLKLNLDFEKDKLINQRKNALIKNLVDDFTIKYNTVLDNIMIRIPGNQLIEKMKKDYRKHYSSGYLVSFNYGNIYFSIDLIRNDFIHLRFDSYYKNRSINISFNNLNQLIVTESEKNEQYSIEFIEEFVLDLLQHYILASKVRNNA